MKNRYLYIALCAAGLLSGATSCNDYLETSSPSTVDKGFVFSTTTTKWAALEGAKKSMMNAYTLVFIMLLILQAPTSCAIQRLTTTSWDAIFLKAFIEMVPK